MGKEGAWFVVVKSTPDGALQSVVALNNTPDGKLNETFNLGGGCYGGDNFNMYIYAPKVISNAALDSKNPTVRVSFKLDDQPPRTENWAVGTNSASPKSSVVFARELMVHKSAMIRVQEPGSSVLGQFDLTGSERTLGVMMDACNIRH